MSQSLQLVVHRPPPATFEDALRAGLRNAPYLGIALFLHGLAFLALFLLRVDLPTVDRTQPPITAAPIEEYVPIVPPAPPLPPEQPPEEKLQEPLVREDPRPETTSAEPEVSPSIEPSFARSPGLLSSALGVGDRGHSGLPFGGGGRGDGGDPSPPTIEAIEAGLRWLAAHQDDDGHWSASSFDDQCGRLGDDVACDGRGSPAFDVGVTGLALLAFAGAGVTESRGRWSENVKRGLRFLVDIQRADGLFAPEWNTQGTYDQSIATLALCEAYSHSRRRALADPAREAIEALLRLRTPGSGWRYMPGHPEMIDPARSADSSVTGWAVLALLSARKAGLVQDDAALSDALAFLDEVTDPETGRTGYTRRGEGSARPAGLDEIWPEHESEALTAASILCRIFGDPELTHPGRRESVAQGVQLVASLPPVWDDEHPGRRDFYYWYYGTYALYQVGGSAWRRWESALADAVLPIQHKQGERRGSWDPQPDPWGSQGGRIYSTSLLVLTLEVYYRYGSMLDVSLPPPR